MYTYTYTHIYIYIYIHTIHILPANAVDPGEAGSISGSGRFPGGRHATNFSVFASRIPMDRGAWQAIVHRVSKSQT